MLRSLSSRIESRNEDGAFPRACRCVVRLGRLRLLRRADGSSQGGGKHAQRASPVLAPTREGTNEPLSGRFAAQRVRHAGGNAGRARLRSKEWLLVEWPEAQAEPARYRLSTLPEERLLEALAAAAHQRWRIERDYQELKQDFGLGRYEGRDWRGLHHHACLSIAAYTFLMAEPLEAEKPTDFVAATPMGNRA